MWIVAFILLSWTLMSLGDSIFEGPTLPCDAKRFERLAVGGNKSSRAHIGIALSGGGYRAAVFTLGYFSARMSSSPDFEHQ